MNNLINKNNLKVNRITIKGKFVILDTPLGLFVIEKNANIKIYDYLISRGFTNIPDIIDYNDSCVLFKYLNGINYNENEKVKDFIDLLSLLHFKTSFTIDYDMQKNINNLKNKIIKTKNYYLNLINIIEENIYYSPNEYYFIRNYSIIDSSLNYLTEELNNLKDIKDKKRVCTLYNNSINNLIKTKDNIYLLDFSKSYVDSPIYDLINLYNKYYKKVDFFSLLNNYLKINPLSNFEYKLFIINIIIPDIVDIKNIKELKNMIDKLYINLEYLKLNKHEDTNAKEYKDNK